MAVGTINFRWRGPDDAVSEAPRALPPQPPTRPLPTTLPQGPGIRPPPAKAASAAAVPRPPRCSPPTAPLPPSNLGASSSTIPYSTSLQQPLDTNFNAHLREAHTERLARRRNEQLKNLQEHQGGSTPREADPAQHSGVSSGSTWQTTASGARDVPATGRVRDDDGHTDGAWWRNHKWDNDVWWDNWDNRDN